MDVAEVASQGGGYLPVLGVAIGAGGEDAQRLGANQQHARVLGGGDLARHADGAVGTLGDECTLDAAEDTLAEHHGMLGADLHGEVKRLLGGSLLEGFSEGGGDAVVVASSRGGVAVLQGFPDALAASQLGGAELGASDRLGERRRDSTLQGGNHFELEGAFLGQMEGAEGEGGQGTVRQGNTGGFHDKVLSGYAPCIRHGAACVAAVLGDNNHITDCINVWQEQF